MIAPITAGLAAMTPEPARPKDAAGAAKQFEALLIAQMLKHAHESSPGSQGEDGDSTGETMWDMAAQQFAQVLAEGGGLGLARMIAPSLLPAPAPGSDDTLAVPLGSRPTTRASGSP
jgi:Rod binding domain-containing protein